MQKLKFSNLEPKIPYLDVLGSILKKHCHIWNQQPGVCLMAKIDGKIDIFKFGTKNALFGYFWAGIRK